MGGPVMRKRWLSLALVLTGALTAACVEDPQVTPSPGPTAAALGSPNGSPSPGVSPTAPPSPTPAPTPQRYRIKAGDSLAGIAQRFGTSIDRILAANPRIVDPNRIEVGDVILIPPKGVPVRRMEIDGIEDPEDDALTEDGSVARTPGYIDISFVEASVAGKDLAVAVTLLGVPRALSPATDEVTYRLLIDTEGDSEPEWIATWSNTLARGTAYGASLEDVVAIRFRTGKQYPGRVEQVGSTLRWILPLKALGNPGAIRVAVSAETVFFPGTPDEQRITDVAPAPIWPSENAQYLEVTLGG
jgi:LysM repeat protein